MDDMNEHEELSREIAALAAGRLEGSARQQIEQHLAACPACAALFEAAREVVAASREEPALLAAHPGVLALQAYARGEPVGSGEQIARHFELCPSCALEVEASRRGLSARPRGRRPRRWFPLAAALAAGLALGLLGPRLFTPPTADWARPAAALVLGDSLRGAADRPVLALPRGQPAVPIVVYLEPADPAEGGGALIFDVREASGRSVWSSSAPAGDPPFTFLIPTERLRSGVHTLSVRQFRAPGSAPLLERSFEVVRTR